ncbi:MAG: DNA repair protein RadA [Muribaculaceae bacterium]|nr:DNA repair protein RadA [Muribaculaceae bacterium]
MDYKFEKARNFFSQISRTIYLYKNLWQEGTTALLHAPRSIDKTTEALTIAANIAASGREILYVNAEERINRCGEIAGDSDNLYVFTPEYESLDDDRDYADIVFDAILQAVTTTSIRTFVIDSVNRIAALSFGKNASPSNVMKRLAAMQVKHRLSLLVIADDTFKSATKSLLALAANEFTMPEEKENDRLDNPAALIADNNKEVSQVENLPSGHSKRQSRSERRARRRHRKQQTRFEQCETPDEPRRKHLHEYFIGDEPLPEDAAHWEAVSKAKSPLFEEYEFPSHVNEDDGNNVLLMPIK